MAFSDETNHRSQGSNCGWGPRAETAEEIAGRLQAFVRSLSRIQPDLNPLWLQQSRRDIRSDDPGRVDQISREELARLIDRRARFDPPQLPAPVGPEGYAIRLSGPPTTDPARHLHVSVYAGRTECAFQGNVCVVDLDVLAPIWRDADQGAALIEAMVDAWTPDWACGWASFPTTDELVAAGAIQRSARPWIVWKRDAGVPDPYEFVDLGPPAVTREVASGQLCVWP